mgnify:CR=1 FL=1
MAYIGQARPSEWYLKPGSSERCTETRTRGRWNVSGQKKAVQLSQDQDSRTNHRKEKKSKEVQSQKIPKEERRERKKDLLCSSQYFWPKPSLPSLGKLNCYFKNGLMMVLIFHIILRVLMCLVQVIGKFYSIGSFLYPGSSYVFLSVIPEVLSSLE